jgi:hypothetical protein
VIWRRQTSLLFALIVVACGSGGIAKPELPQSVSPGWKLSSLDRAAAPAGVPPDGSPECWKGDYGGPGSVRVWLCGYKVRESAFDAVQRARTEAQMVKFQEGSYLVLVQWNNVSKENLTALVRAIQKAVQPK